MIIGNIADYSEKEFAYSNNLKAAFKYIKEQGLEGLLKLPVGKNVIQDGKFWVLRQSYVGKKFEDAKTEGHQKCLDIQIILKGEEGIGYVDKRKAGLKVTEPFDVEKDRAFYDGKLDGIINLSAGFFCLVLPNDLHKPCLKVNDEQIEKAVVKVVIDF
jgi:biofilm protein TabA